MCTTDIHNICFILPDFGCGGAQRVVANLANAFDQHGFSVSIFCFNSDEINPFYTLNTTIKLINLPSTFKRNRRRIFKNALMCRKIFKELNADLVIAFLLPVSMYAFFATRFSKIKFIVSERNDPDKTIKYKDWKHIRNYVFKHADACVFQTEAAQCYFGKRVFDKSMIIENPLILSNKCNETILSKDREKRIVCIGRYDPQKNLPLLIRTFARFLRIYPDYVLEIYGRDFHNYENILFELINLLGLENKVFLMGPQDNLHNKIYKAKMSILTSNYEGMPNALLETIALGIPSISTDCPIGGPRAIIQDGINGFLIPMNDEDALLDKMKYIIENPHFADKMSYEGRKIADRYSMDKIYSEWIKLLKKTLNLSFKEEQ